MTADHATTIHVSDHRRGVKYARWSCSCGAYGRTQHRPVSLAAEHAAAHVRMAGK